MLTKEQVLEAVKNGRKSECLDGRDYGRLVDFFPVDDWVSFGIALEKGIDYPPVIEWTESNIIAKLESDLDFAFQKALGQRGISAGLMYETIKMWMWVLEDPLQHHSSYAQYGLPLLKMVAIKYSFDNQIGGDVGNEHKYSAEG